MKLKKIFACLLCFVCAFFLVGCGRDVSTKPLKMDRYFKQEVISRYSISSTDKLLLGSFTKKNVDTSTLNLHKSLQFTGIPSWLFCMYIECVYFYYYSPNNEQVNQLKFSINALENGDEYDITTNSYKIEKIIALNPQKNNGTLIRVDVGQKVILTDCILTLSLEDEVLLHNSNYKWTIYGLQFYGEIRT